MIIYIFASVFNSVISIFTNKIKDVFNSDPLRRDHLIINHDGDDLSLKDITWCHVGGILFMQMELPAIDRFLNEV